MTDNNVALANIDRLPKQTFEQLQAQTLTAVVISLGSNHQAEQHLATVRQKIANLGKMKLSTPLQNPDITATLEQPKPDYSNQCAYLALNSLMTLQQLQQLFKQFENDCNRQRQVENTDIEQVAIKQVTMDIDILLVKLESASEWIVMAERYPFENHEMIGVGELLAGKYLYLNV